MIGWIKQSGMAFAAYHLSSVITVLQLAWAKVVWPEEYNWVMDAVGSVVVPAWHFVCQLFVVFWDYLNTS